MSHSVFPCGLHNVAVVTVPTVLRCVQVLDARRVALHAAPLSASWLVLFRTQAAAAAAAQCTIHPERNDDDDNNDVCRRAVEMEGMGAVQQDREVQMLPGGVCCGTQQGSGSGLLGAGSDVGSGSGGVGCCSFGVRPAPGPDEINWPTLWMRPRERRLRRAAVLPLVVALLLLVPVGLFSGGLQQLNALLCPTTALAAVGADAGAGGGAWRWRWYCAQRAPAAQLLRRVVVGWLPALLISLWQGMALPVLNWLLIQVRLSARQSDFLMYES